MYIQRMLIQDLRILQSVDVRLQPGLNLFVGSNGSGKTSLLEAAHLLSYGRSFRSGGRDALIQRGRDTARVYAEVRAGSGAVHRLGIERTGSSWRGRVNENDVDQLSELFRLCAVCCFEPGSHELISGTADARRAMFDWGLFHVEQDFLVTWRRYQRALRQRNVLLKEQAPDDWFLAWETEMASSAAMLLAMRERHAQALNAEVVATAADVLPEFTGAILKVASGWKDDVPRTAAEVMERLAAERPRDRERGFTRRGPHRADWSLEFDQIPRREYFSRGQEKLAALTMVLAQFSCLQQLMGDWPILVLDDLASELDRRHQSLALAWVRQRPIQVLLTGVTTPDAVEASHPDVAVFHVEQGQISAA